MQRHQFPSQPPQLSSNTACQWVSDTKQLDPSPNTTGKRWHHHRENLVLEGVLSTKSKHKSWEASKGTIYAAGLKALSWWMTMLGSHLPINSSFRTGLNRIVYGLGTAVDFGLGKHCCCKCRQEKGVQNKNEKLWMCSPLLLQQIHVDIFRMNNRPMSPVFFFFLRKENEKGDTSVSLGLATDSEERRGVFTLQNWTYCILYDQFLQMTRSNWLPWYARCDSTDTI